MPATYPQDAPRGPVVACPTSSPGRTATSSPPRSGHCGSARWWARGPGAASSASTGCGHVLVTARRLPCPGTRPGSTATAGAGEPRGGTGRRGAQLAGRLATGGTRNWRPRCGSRSRRWRPGPRPSHRTPRSPVQAPSPAAAAPRADRPGPALTDRGRMLTGRGRDDRPGRRADRPGPATALAGIVAPRAAARFSPMSRRAASARRPARRTRARRRARRSRGSSSATARLVPLLRARRAQPVQVGLADPAQALLGFVQLGFGEPGPVAGQGDVAACQRSGSVGAPASSASISARWSIRWSACRRDGLVGGVDTGAVLGHPGRSVPASQVRASSSTRWTPSATTVPGLTAARSTVVVIRSG